MLPALSHRHPHPPTVTTTSRPSSQPLHATSTTNQTRDIDHHIDRIFSTLETSSKERIIEDASSPSNHNINQLTTNDAANANFLNNYLNIAHGQYEADEDESTGE